MGDDLTIGGILPVDDSSLTDKEFDPGALDSDAFLDDFAGEDLSDELPLEGEDDDDPLFPDEVE